MRWTKKFRVLERRSKVQIHFILTWLETILDSLLNWTLPILALVTGGIVIYDVGFNAFYSIDVSIWQLFHWLIILTAIFLILRFIQQLILRGLQIQTLMYLAMAAGFTYLSIESSLYIISSASPHDTLLMAKGLHYGMVLLLSASEISKLAGKIYNRGVSPGAIFAGSFLFFILVGTGLLLLPRCTYQGIQAIDALFMSSSAVCVTGLATIPLDQFTLLGQLVILGLLQIGGLGVMTFAGLLGYSLSGKASFQSQIALKSMIQSNQLSDIVKTVNTIIGISLLFELLGALILFLSAPSGAFSSQFHKMYFAVFHSVSAFCNAGFSTLPNGLANTYFAESYTLLWTIMLLIMLGGMGFPIIFNIYNYILHHCKNGLNLLIFKRPKKYAPRLLNLTSRLALQTSLILLLVGFGFILYLEWNNALQNSTHWFHTITHAMFTSVTTRTAGFNTLDFSAFKLSSILIIILLMWIGASPASTGGGIKTTTFALAILNMASVVRGKTRTEFNRREISDQSIKRSFAVVLISLGIIGLATLGVAIFDFQKGILKILFEVFSAFSTVGLSLGITEQLSNPSKLILSATMFLGRVGTLTLLVAMVKQTNALKYKYPKEEVLL